jgi:hypothetical protein
MKPQDLQEHIARTYTTLRVGIVGLAIGLPIILWLGGSSWRTYHFKAR